MRYIIDFKLFENVKPYSFYYDGFDGASYHYFFTDDKNKFRVEFDKRPYNEIEITYRVLNQNNKWSFEMVETNIFRIMETIFGHILPDFIKQNPWCESFVIKGLGKITEKEPITQRTKAYMRYLQKNPVEGWNIDRYGNEISLLKKD
jgi:hypothetical protein